MSHSPEELTVERTMSFGDRLRAVFDGHPSWGQGPQRKSQVDLGLLRKIAPEEADALQTQYANDPDGMPEEIVKAIESNEEVAREARF